MNSTYSGKNWLAKSLIYGRVELEATPLPRFIQIFRLGFRAVMEFVCRSLVTSMRSMVWSRLVTRDPAYLVGGLNPSENISQLG